jgi:hypothetical protein
MASGGAPHDGDAIGIDAEFSSMSPKVADSVFAVLQVDWKFSGGAKGVVHAGSDVAVFGQGGPEFDFAGLPLVAFLPTASVNEKDGRAFFPGLPILRQVKVELFRAAWIQKRNIPPDLYLRAGRKLW